jgi:hypothetical protein
MPTAIFSRLWRSDWHLSVLLCLLLLVVFIIYPMGTRSTFAAVLRQSILSLLLISGAVLVARTRAALGVVGVLALVTALAGWVQLGSRGQWVNVLSLLMLISFLGLLVIAILFRVFEEGEINIHRIQGAVAVYLLLGVIWAGCYRLVIEIDPTAFNLPTAADDGSLMSKLVYFSFVTLTTVGYGDITAVATPARSLAMLEALTGQLFPAVLIARLVSMEVTHRMEKRSRN